MKFRDCIEESDLSSSYNKIIKKVNADVKNVSSILKYDEEDMYENPNSARTFWRSFYDEMNLLKGVLNGYFQLLGEIPGHDEIFNNQDLGQIETKLRELSVLISKKLNSKDDIKI